ncbi:hypothetical protein NHP190012_09240 [Helicobacter sp. NHP19-012]|uniref:Citrate transporter-like domain-containing protein n=1 Tax=Helicobacter gastrofelis TaxID=2849642 RepID=A0ABN6I8D3_9HELI|nr:MULTISPECIES: SLC13 family permease [unclassified Helicobacter]BCZ19282.1 hypothetical protein NHP190012_09240 [Helicobacter sp. NHP19-012]GMB96059.1 hypothetical protein NHP22001_06480 [Helicobacter sp. NHP22-001]
MLTLFAILIITSLIALLLTDKLSPMVALTLVPLGGLFGFWLTSALIFQPVVPKNYAYMLSHSNEKHFLKHLAKDNGFDPPDGHLRHAFRKAGNVALGFKPKMKDYPPLSKAQVEKFYLAGAAALYPNAKHIEENLAPLFAKHNALYTFKDHMQELVRYFKQGIGKVAHIAIMFIFAILFFGVLNDVGVFNPLINALIKLSQGSVVAVCVGTCLIAMIAHLDGSGASTFLVVIPPLLPIYKRLNMNPYLLLLLVAASAGVANMLPWGGPLGRIASVLGTDVSALYTPLIKVQLLGFACILLMAVFLGFKEKRRIMKTGLEVQGGLGVQTLDHPRFFWINVVTALIALGSVMLKILPPEFCFLLALCAVLLINYANPKERMAKVKEYAPEAISMAVILLAAGVYIGILSGSGMLVDLAQHLSLLLPDFATKHLHIITGVFGVPFELLLDTNGYYFTLFPIVAHITAPYGVSGEATGYAMLIGSIVGTFVSPFAPALWLGLGLAKLSMGRHIAYSFFWLWGLSLVVLALAKLLGLF